MSKHYKNPGRGFDEPEDLGSGAMSAPSSDPRIARELESNEELIWAGRPDPSRMGCRSMPIVIFGIPFTAISVFWVLATSGVLFGSIGGGGRIVQILFTLFGVPFVLVGLFMLTAPFWAKRAAKRTLYALTDRRCIIWQHGLRTTTVKSYGPDDLGSMSRVERKNGAGDVIFVQSMRIRDRSGSSDTVTQAEGFMGVEDPRTLERLIRDTLLSEFSVPGGTSY
ncbi:MAG: hypothetical protein ACIAQF_09440 [Phycisphaerales bacterium JB065]